MDKIGATIIWPANRAAALLAFIFVKAYQHLISPYKGFLCAHGAFTAEPSCSQVAASTFLANSFSQSLPIIHTQFRRCRTTYTFAKRNPDLFDIASAEVKKMGIVTATGILACPCLGSDADDDDNNDPGPLGQVIQPVDDMGRHDGKNA